MIYHYYKHSSDRTLSRHETAKAGAWTYVEQPSEAELDTLVEDFGLEPRFLRDALDRDEIPRLESVEEYTYVFTRFAYQTRDKTIESVPILFVINKDSLITVSLEKLPALATILASTSSDHMTTDPAKLMLQLLLEINKYYDVFINDARKHIRHLRDRLGKRDIGTKDFVRFVVLEDDLHDFLSSLEPTNAALRRLLDDRDLPAFAKHRDIADTVLLNNEQSIQACNNDLKTIDSIRRTFALISSNNLDRSINWLSIAAVVIAIPTLLYSLYGMNMPLPFQKETWLFPAILLLSILFCLVVFAYGRRKKLF